MMNYPPYTSQFGHSFAETFEHLVQLRQSLLNLLKSSTMVQDHPQKHSLFSSRKKYKREELHSGVIGIVRPFSLN